MIICLDLDGTLIDSTLRHCILMRELLNGEGIFIAKDFDDSFMNYKRSGNSGLQFLIEYLRIDKEKAGIIVNQWVRKIEEESYINTDILYPDAVSFLDSIYKDNVVYYISNRKNGDLLLNELKRLGIAQYAKRVFVCDPADGSDGKKRAIISISEKETKSILVGDTEIDYEAANKAMINCILLNRGFRSKKYWDERNIRSFNNLNEILEEIKERAKYEL